MTQTSSGADDASTTDRVREAGSHVAGTAADEAANVKNEVGYQAKNLVGQVRNQVSGQVSTQKERAAGGIRTVSDQLRTMADSSESEGMASNLVSQAASRAGDVAGWLEAREPADLLEDAKRFARRRPGLFIAIAAAAGIVVGRLAKSLASGNDSSKQDTSYQAGRDDYIGDDPTIATTGAGYSGTTAYGDAGYTTTPGYTGQAGSPDYQTSGDLR
ncbi:hypothetical protein [Mycetocola sp.]|uniref:hypothetical protein n=1 Tax=Mycetocola sp. TaxID=1871042 RepID=UPI003989003F